jgi:DNA-binding ferritin-like protein (oxidative damage protectant)
VNQIGIKESPKYGSERRNRAQPRTDKRKSRESVIRILNRLLADEYVLYTKTRKYHWNVTGPRFKPLHDFFKAQYEELETIIDEVAERVPQLGGKAVATLEEFSAVATLVEDPGQYPDDNKMLSNLLNDHEALIRNLRTDADATDEKYHDMGTNDFLIGLMQQHEKTTWMLRAHLEGK